jgi:hypothetical protein
VREAGASGRLDTTTDPCGGWSGDGAPSGRPWVGGVLSARERDSELSEIERLKLLASTDSWSGKSAFQTGMPLYLTLAGGELYYDVTNA